jgi:hypothetical protein
MPEKFRRIGAYSWSTTLAKVDGRTKVGMMLREVRRDLLKHVGGKPTVVQRMLIDRAAVLTLRLALLDEKIIADHPLTEHDTNHIIAWQNALTRVLNALGVGAAAAPSDPLEALHRHLAGREAGREAA